MKINASTEANSINISNSSTKTFINNEKQDLLHFKNDILKDFRLLEEKINLKLTEQNEKIKGQYEQYEIKLNKLSNRIDEVNLKIVDNTDFTDKINDLQKFKSKAAENFDKLNTKMNTTQKENRDYINNIEKIINDNLRYPGVIGSNARFSNFKHFIDYIIRTFKEFNEFKKEIRDLDFNEFKKQINSDIQNFRFAISDSNRNALRLINNTFKEFDSKMNDLIKQNKQMINENEEKIKDFKNKINESFSEYQNKFATLEKNINDKHNEQLNEFTKFKIMSNNFIQEMKDIKANIESMQKENEAKEQDFEKNILMKINNISKPEIFRDQIENSKIDDNDNIDFKKSLFNKKEEYQFLMNSKNISNLKDLLINNNNNNVEPFFLKNNNYEDKFQNSEEKNNTEHFRDKKMNLSLSLEKSNSLERMQNMIKFRKYYLENEINELKIPSIKEDSSFNQENIMNNKENMSVPKSEMKKQSEKNNFLKYSNTLKKESSNSNYSNANISNIKLKRVALPEYMNNKNLNQISKSLMNDNKEIKKLPNNNNFSFTTTKKYIFHNDHNNKSTKNSLDIPKINEHKEEKTKHSGFYQSARNFYTKAEAKVNDNIDSLLIIKSKNKNNCLNSSHNLRRSKKKSLSFDEERIEKKGKRKSSFNEKTYKLSELLLVNSKNYRKSRKIKL